VGNDETVLVERPGLGRTESFTPVLFDGPEVPGTFVRARITAATSDKLMAVIAR